MKLNSKLLVRRFWIVFSSFCYFIAGGYIGLFFFAGLLFKSNPDQAANPVIVWRNLGALLLFFVPIALCVYILNDEILESPKQKDAVWTLWLFHCILLLIVPALIAFDLLYH